MSNPKWEEIIVAAPVEKIFKGGDYAWQGLLVNDNERAQLITEHVLEVLQRESIHIRRGDKHDPTPKENNAEINYDYKQPIPYGIVTSDDNDIAGIRVFVYERLAGGTETRLHNTLSIGVGGHMNVLPIYGGEPVMDIITDEAVRELEEELIFEDVTGEASPVEYPIEVIGLLNDETNDVGKVHLGILYAIQTPPAHHVSVRETDALKGTWMTLEELTAVKDRLESWSQIALEALLQIEQA